MISGSPGHKCMMKVVKTLPQLRNFTLPTTQSNHHSDRFIFFSHEVHVKGPEDKYPVHGGGTLSVFSCNVLSFIIVSHVLFSHFHLHVCFSSVSIKQ